MSEALRLLALNGAYECLGLGLLLSLGIRARRVLSVDFALLGYACGVAGDGIIGAQLALVERLPGLAGTWIVAGIALGVGALRTRVGRGRQQSVFGGSSWTWCDGVAAIGSLGVVGLTAARLRGFPLGDWDGWAIWATKAHALYSSGGVGSPVFRSAAYARTHLDYPLLFPSLEASELRALGHFDGAALHLELVSLLAAFAAGLLALLRSAATPPPVRMVVVLGLVGSPALLSALATNYADVPLAFFVALGLVALARWTMTGDRLFLTLASLFLAAALLTKDEGALFAIAAYAAALALGTRLGGRRQEVVIAALASIAMVVPWRVFAATHHLHDGDYSPAKFLSVGFLVGRLDRLNAAVDTLTADIFGWELLWLGSALALLVALSARRYRVIGFAGIWAICSFAGLATSYWGSLLPIQEHLNQSANRVITSIIVGSFALSALVVGDAVQRDHGFDKAA